VDGAYETDGEVELRAVEPRTAVPSLPTNNCRPPVKYTTEPVSEIGVPAVSEIGVPAV